jgi:hypothetical protein
MEVRTDNFVASVKYRNPPAVDVMPAQETDVGYLIPAGNRNGWQDFNPDKLEAVTKRSMDRAGPRFATVVRLVKYWNVARGLGLKSSDLEEVASVALGGAGVIPSLWGGLSQVLYLFSDWVDGDAESQTRMQRAFDSDRLGGHAREILREATEITRMMSPVDNADSTSELIGEFFGDKLADLFR